ncbi:hypothetical protein ACFO0A_02775 [Novosphingobium tardum]|uniref:CBM-cenC domain-containing protein n=1 Tax=Novosphingobium tardum TaxID=1538021 RepID=A0ABV8RL43_9SPHN
MGDTQAMVSQPARWKLAVAMAGALAAFAIGAGDTFALATRNPALAQSIAGWSGATKSKHAELLVQNARSLSAIPEVKSAAIAALVREPLDFNAARTLGSIAIRENDIPLGRAIFTAVGQQTLREPVSHFWLMSDTYARGRYGDFLKEAEVILRQKPEMSPQIFTLFTRLADGRRVTERLIQRLASRPEWRPGFFDVLGEQSTNSDAAYEFYTRLARTKAPPSPAELRVWLRHEVGRTDGDVLVGRWKSLQRPPLPARERLIRNPDFEGSVAPQPFDWTFYLPEGSFAEIGPSPDGPGKALYVEMTGRDNETVASQILDLAPGRYRFSARYYPVSDISRRELTISLTCAQGRNFSPLAKSALDATPERWSRWQWDVDLPAGCNVQQLSIGMEPRALTADARSYFDDFAVTRLGS